MKRKQIRVAELFSGIGSQAKALTRISDNFRCFKPKFVFTCEWEIHAAIAYDVIQSGNKYIPVIPEVLELTDEQVSKRLKRLNLSSNGKYPLGNYPIGIGPEGRKRLLTSLIRSHNKIDVQSLVPQDLASGLDILTYSFPCQDLSNVKAFHGMTEGINPSAKTHSGLLWTVVKLLEDTKAAGIPLPKCLLLENVMALESRRNLKFFLLLQDKLQALGYYNKVFHLYAPDFGVPQTRQRLIMISSFVGEDTKLKESLDAYYLTHNLDDRDFVASLGYPRLFLKDVLKLDYTNPAYLHEAEASHMNDTPSRRRIWEDNHELIRPDGTFQDYSQTLTTKQDRNPNSGNLFIRFSENPLNKPGKACYRNLTPRECMLLMGFDEQDYENLLSANFKMRNNDPMTGFFARDMIYKLTGNSIVVNMLEGAFRVLLASPMFEFEAMLPKEASPYK